MYQYTDNHSYDHGNVTNSRLVLCIKYTSICLIYLWLYSHFVGSWLLFQFINLYTVSRARCTGDQPVARQLPAQAGQHKQNKRTQIFMTEVGLEPTIPAFE
jgi:hypothetical protein